MESAVIKARSERYGSSGKGILIRALEDMVTMAVYLTFNDERMERRRGEQSHSG